MCDQLVPQGQRAGYREVVDMWAQLDASKFVGLTSGSSILSVLPSKLDSLEKYYCYDYFKRYAPFLEFLDILSSTE